MDKDDVTALQAGFKAQFVSRKEFAHHDEDKRMHESRSFESVHDKIKVIHEIRDSLRIFQMEVNNKLEKNNDFIKDVKG